jgi:hypothetical protein
LEMAVAAESIETGSCGQVSQANTDLCTGIKRNHFLSRNRAVNNKSNRNT